jgi:tRNA-specific 2-thiouridylase
MVEGARRVCAQIGVPYYVFNYQREFRRSVIQYFMKEYAHGYTPNPCLACNRDLKFRFLLERAQMLGFDYLATGHYARIRTIDDADGRTANYQLLRGVDRAKDQSYVLYMLQQHELSRIMFPLGDYRKPEVRSMAAERGLATADRPESQDICFIPDNDYRRFLREEQPESIRTGPILDQQGHEVGRHNGLPLYTIGQRRGLGLATGQPLYVVELDVARNAVIVGPSEALQRPTLEATEVKFVNGVWPDTPFDCTVQIRAHAAPVEAHITPGTQGHLYVAFARPQRAVTPGQAVVLYNDDLVLGGGRISNA